MTTRRLFIALFAVALFTMAVRETLDPDMWWHLRTGELILHEGIPRQDTFSFTVPDHEWITHEWLSQVLMWWVYDLAGFGGLITVFALLTALSYWLLYQATAGRPFLAAFVVLLAAMTSAIVWGVRPQIFNILLTATFVYLVEGVRNGRFKGAHLWLLSLLTLLWANLHSGYLLGIVLLGTYVVGEGLQRWFAPTDARALPWRAVRLLGIVTAVSFLVAAINPSGPRLWIYPFFTLGSQAMQVYIQEWHSPDFHLSFFWPFAAMLALGVIALVLSEKRPTWSQGLLFLGTAAAGLLSARHIPLFAAVTTPIICDHLYSSLRPTRVGPFLRQESPSPPPPPLLQGVNWLLLLLAIAAAIGWTANIILENDEMVAARYPVAAVTYLEENGLATARGYNSYNWGGYLIWRGLPVFVDGRADVYGDEFLFYYRQAFDGQVNWREPLQAFAVQYVLMERNSVLHSLLSGEAGWQAVYEDDLAVIFVREDALP